MLLGSMLSICGFLLFYWDVLFNLLLKTIDRAF
jgi:hypothetical protein